MSHGGQQPYAHRNASGLQTGQRAEQQPWIGALTSQPPRPCRWCIILMSSPGQSNILGEPSGWSIHAFGFFRAGSRSIASCVTLIYES